MTHQTIIPINYIERKPGSEHYRVVGKGVTVALLSRLIGDSEWTVARICQNYGLTPAEIHDAWAFYYDHQAEIDAHVSEAAARFDAAADADIEKRARIQARYREKTGQDYPGKSGR